jgi:integrase
MWEIPAERMKAKRAHRVPLSDRCIEILKALPREPNNPFIFIGANSNVGSDAIYRLLRGVTTHGFRSTFTNWCHEHTGCSNHVIELSLAHSIGTATEQAYRRTDLADKRRRLMADWGKMRDNFCIDGWRWFFGSHCL